MNLELAPFSQFASWPGTPSFKNFLIFYNLNIRVFFFFHFLLFPLPPMKLPLFFTLTLCFTTLCSAQPAAFWASSPVTSGETALVYGGNFTPDAVVVVESTPFGETCEVKPVYASATCVMFPWPEEIGDGEALVSIRTPEGFLS